MIGAAGSLIVQLPAGMVGRSPVRNLRCHIRSDRTQGTPNSRYRAVGEYLHK
jgi:hypothetical protein